MIGVEYGANLQELDWRGVWDDFRNWVIHAA